MLRLRLYWLYLQLPGFRGKSRLEYLLRRWLFPAEEIGISQGIRMALDPYEWVQRDLLAKGDWEPQTIRLFRKLLKPGDVYVDIGCHVGYHSLVARTLIGASGKVIAVDPQPYNCEKILANWQVNDFDNLIVYPAAVGNLDSWVSLPAQPPTDKSRLSLLDSAGIGPTRQFAVPIYRLETILQREQVKQVSLLKIDTEGYEYEVLKGGQNILRKIENIILEILPENQKTGEQVASLLHEVGMRLCTVEGEAWSLGQPLPENNLWATRAVGTLM